MTPVAMIGAVGMGVAVPLLWGDDSSGRPSLSAHQVEERLLQHPLRLPFGGEVKQRPSCTEAIERGAEAAGGAA